MMRRPGVLPLLEAKPNVPPRTQRRRAAHALLTGLILLVVVVPVAGANATSGTGLLTAVPIGAPAVHGTPILSITVAPAPISSATPTGVLIGSTRARSNGTRLRDGRSDVAANHPSLPAAAPRTSPRLTRFGPGTGAEGVDPAADLSVGFTTAMDPPTTARAFSANIVGGAPIAGTYRWAADDTVLVLRPDRPLPFGARVELAVTANATSADGVPLAKPGSATFTIISKAAASSASDGPWQWPLIGPITQYFTQTLTEYGVHEGIDIAGRTGDPVGAARGGRVLLADRVDNCGGLQVRIDHGGGFVSAYHHLSRIDVRVGQIVTSGTIIGLVGNTGCSLGSHLDFVISDGPFLVDPLDYLPLR